MAESSERFPVSFLAGIGSDQRGEGEDVGGGAVFPEALEKGGGISEAVLASEDGDDDGEQGATSTAR